MFFRFVFFSVATEREQLVREESVREDLMREELRERF